MSLDNAQLYAHIVHKLNIGYALIDEQLKILSTNLNLIEGISKNTTDLVGQSLLKIFPELAEVQDKLARLGQNRFGMFNRSKIYRPTADGMERYFDLHIEPTDLTSEAKQTSLVTVTEVTERVTLENELTENHNALSESLAQIERAKQEWEVTADSLSELVCLVDQQGKIIRANRTVERWNLGQVVNIKGQAIQQLFHADWADFWQKAWAELWQGRSIQHEVDDQKLERHLFVQVQPIASKIKQADNQTVTSFAAVVIQDDTERKRAEEALRLEQEKSERLLLNILPEAIAARLKQAEGVIADSFSNVTVMFADIVGFTKLSSGIPAIKLVNMLNEIFSAFDQLAEQYNLEKIKTIGDSYMVVGGLPVARHDHAEAIAEMALEMQKTIATLNIKNDKSLSLRIGINTGAVVAGVIGSKKFIYDLWGDTVNIAARMESHGIEGRIQVSAATYHMLWDKYHFDKRGSIEVKGKGKMMTYFLIDRK